jgi:hypothetical protein
MVNRVTVTLEQPEYSALLDMALAELRNPPDQLHHILRKELREQGLIGANDEPLAQAPASVPAQVTRPGGTP